MINFFRKIRKKMADDNKPMKYIRYAIGEILLVVIGILIALQVNTWNENRKSKNTEVLLLDELISNLEADIYSINYDFNTHTEALESCNRILRTLDENKEYNDSFSIDISHTNCYSVFKYNQGAYQSLKSIGIETISDRKLISQIVDLYDHWYEIYAENQRILTEDILNFKRNYYNRVFNKFQVFKIEDDEFKYGGEMIPLNFDSLKNDGEFKYIILSLKESHEQLLYLNKFIANMIESLKKEILIGTDS